MRQGFGYWRRTPPFVRLGQTTGSGYGLRRRTRAVPRAEDIVSK